MTPRSRSNAAGPAADRAGDKAPVSLFASPEVPLYYQLSSVIREQITSGRYASGDRIPTEAELVSQYGVSRITVRQALATLEREGLLRREVGRGTFVNEWRPFTAGLNVEGSLDDLISMGMSTSVKLLEVRTLHASRQEAESLGLDPGALITRCVRLRYYHQDPYGHIVVDLPAEIGRKLTRADFKGSSILRILEDRMHIRIRDAQQTVRASLADASLAQLLETRIGAPLLCIDRIVMSDDGRPVQRVKVHYRSDLFAFSVHLHRNRDEKSWNRVRRRQL